MRGFKQRHGQFAHQSKPKDYKAQKGMVCIHIETSTKKGTAREKRGVSFEVWIVDGTGSRTGAKFLSHQSVHFDAQASEILPNLFSAPSMRWVFRYLATGASCTTCSCLSPLRKLHHEGLQQMRG